MTLSFYGYATSVCSSPKLEQATEGHLRLDCFSLHRGQQHPDHDTIANFRKRFPEQLKPLFLEILPWASAAPRS